MGGARPPRRRGVVSAVAPLRQRLAAAAAAAATAAVLLGGAPAAAAPAAVTLSARLAVRQQQARQGTSWSFTPDGRRKFRVGSVCAETGLCKAEYRYPCASSPDGTCTRTVTTRCVWRCGEDSPSVSAGAGGVTVPDATAGGDDGEAVVPADAVDGDGLEVDGDDESVLSTLQVDGGGSGNDSGASTPIDPAVSPVAGEPIVAQPDVPVSGVPSDSTGPDVTIVNDEDAVVPTDAAIEDALEAGGDDESVTVLPTPTLPTGEDGDGSDSGASTVSGVPSDVTVPDVTAGNDEDAVVPTDAAVEDALEAEDADEGATVLPTPTLPTGEDGDGSGDGGASSESGVPSNVVAPEVTADGDEDAVVPTDGAVEDALEVGGDDESVLPIANVDEAELTTDPAVDEPELTADPVVDAADPTEVPAVDEPELTADPAVDAADPTEVPEEAEDEAAASDSPLVLPYTFGDGIRTCSLDSVRTRRDIRTYSADELSALTSAWAALYTSSTLTDLTAIHVAAHHVAHGGAAFLPWHKLFLLELEAALRSISPGLALPYWPWAADAEDLAAAPVWSASAFGRANTGNCIADGNFFGVTGSRGRCVLRGFTSTSGGIPPVAVVQQGTIDEAVMAERGGYAAFVAAAESFHNELHVSLSGDMGVGYSPDDPTFWAHHAYVDSWWASRQEWSPNDYGGTHRRVPVSTTDTLWPYNITVADAIALPCVRYAPVMDAATVSRQAETPTTPVVDVAEAEALVARREAVVGPPSIEFAVRMGDDRETAVAGRAVAVAVQVAAAVSGAIDVTAYERVDEPPVGGRFNGSEDVARGPDGVPAEPVPVLYAGGGGEYPPRPTKEVVGAPAYPPVATPAYPPVVAPAYPLVAEPTYSSQEAPAYSLVAAPTYSSQEASAYSPQQAPAYPAGGVVAPTPSATPKCSTLPGESHAPVYSSAANATDSPATASSPPYSEEATPAYSEEAAPAYSEEEAASTYSEEEATPASSEEATPTYSEEATPAYSEEASADFSDGTPAYPAAATPVISPVATPATHHGADPYTYPGSTPHHTACADDVDGGEAGLLPTVEPIEPPSDEVEGEETAAPAEYEDAWTGGDPYGADTAEPTTPADGGSGAASTPTPYPEPVGGDGDATPALYSGPYEGVEDEAAATSSPSGIDGDASPAPYSGPYEGVEGVTATTPSPSAGLYGPAAEAASVAPATPYEYGVGGAPPATTAAPYAPVASATPAPYAAATGGGTPTPTPGSYGDDDGDAPAVTTGAYAYGDEGVEGVTAATPSPSAGPYRPAAEVSSAAPEAPTKYGTEGPVATATAAPYAPGTLYGSDGTEASAVPAGAGGYGDQGDEAVTAATPSPPAGLYEPAAEAVTPFPHAHTEYGAGEAPAAATAVPYAPVASVTPAPYGDAVGDGLPAGTAYGSVHE